MRKILQLFYRRFRKQYVVLGVAAAVLLIASACFSAANPLTQKDLVQPDTLAKELQGSGAKPLLLQVGFQSLYFQGHIPDSKYCGPGRSADGIARLKACLKDVPHTRAIVLYCGCCPWEECPNVRPAFEAVKEMGYKNVKVVYFEGNFGRDWAQHGYPVARGE
jgi:thiosulfate/3-mercaptopyruvate sulfurtransferase